MIKFKDYNEAYPEEYEWVYIDSILLSELGCQISEEIKTDIKTDGRTNTPGLRRALRIIARRANVI